MALLCLAALGTMLAAAVIAGGPADCPAESIGRTLAGMTLTYYSIAGQPMNYTIGAGDIQSIDRAVYAGMPAWKVRVGQGLQWDLTMDASGTRVLDVEQLFVT